jgi:hypothetical protein
MSDRISTYRVVRLSIHVPAVDGAWAPWSLIATGVRGGIPTSRILVDGRVHLAPRNPTTEEILEAFDAAIRQSML